MCPLASATSDKFDPTAADYIRHAREANRIAGQILQLNMPETERDVEELSGKFSLGLSLQAGELAGKAMLRSLGHTPQEIRDDHKRHDLPTLLDAVQDDAQQRYDQGELVFEPFTDFMCTSIEIDGKPYRNTIGDYLHRHFSKGPSAFPRSYFYPDLPWFSAPTPFHTLHKIVEDLIGIAESLDKVAHSHVHPQGPNP